jgi:outer membrane usher protein
MPGSSTPKSIWTAGNLPIALLSGALFTCLPDGAAGQGAEMELRLSRRLSEAPLPRIEQRTASAATTGRGGSIRLALSRELVPVAASAPRERSPAAPGSAPSPPPAAQRAPQSIAQGAAPRRDEIAEMLLQVDVNQQRLGETVIVLKSRDGTLYVAGEDLDRWRLRRPGTPPYEHDGKLYYPTSALPQLTLQVDERKQLLTITGDSRAFTGTVAEVSAMNYPPPVLPQPGGFLNYTLNATRFAGETASNGLFEAGFFSRHGVLTSSVLASELTRSATWLRLETTYAIDYPDRLTSLRLGDAVGVPGAWGRAVRFGGIQYGTNFATQPGFIRSPVLQAAGSAALPSTVDVFVNNALVQRNSVPPGPFSVQNIPVVTGSGEVRVVVRDLLGREQVITQPYYSGATLLKKGLSDYSFELGAVRDNFAITSNDYGTGLATATYRKGITDGFTGELHGEYTRGVQAGGATGALRLGNFGIVNGTAALSNSERGIGQLLGYGFEHYASPLGISLQTHVTSPEFRQIGMTDTELPRRRQTSANATYTMGNWGSLSLGYAIQQFRDSPTAEVATLSYAVPLGNLGNLSLSMIRSYGAAGATSAFLSLTVPFGEQSSAMVTGDRTRVNATGLVDRNLTAVVQRNLPLGDGFGYRLQDHNGDLLGSLSLQNGAGTYMIEQAVPKEGGNASRLGIAGGIGMVGGHPFLSRTITDSFGVVRVADFPNVRVLQDNQVVARTNADGYAVLPRMRAYDRNQVSLDQNDLPFDAALGSLRLDAVPYFRSGVLLDFPVKRVRAGTLHIVLEDGSPLPSGALARIDGKNEEFPVALRGEAYLEGFETSNRLLFTWRGQKCMIDVPYPRSDDLLPELGTFVCKGVKP